VDPAGVAIGGFSDGASYALSLGHPTSTHSPSSRISSMESSAIRARRWPEVGPMSPRRGRCTPTSRPCPPRPT
jgi:hypothetical protein